MTVTVPTDPYVIFTDTDPEVLRLYGLLPEMFRRYDEADTTCEGGYPFLRWLDIQFRWFGDIATLMDRFNFPEVNTTTSDLVDPYTSNDEWLTWLSQLVNISVTATPGQTTSSSWEFLAAFVDAIANGGNGDGIPTWAEWQFGDRTWQQLQDANLAQRSQLTPVRDSINRRRTLDPDPYITARAAYGYYDGSAPAIARAVSAVLGGHQYVWVGSYADLVTLGPVYPTKVTLAGSDTEFFELSGEISLSGLSNIVTFSCDHTVADAVDNTIMSYGEDITVSSTTAGITVSIGTQTWDYVGALAGRAEVEVSIDFSTPGHAVVTVVRTPNGGGPSTLINAVDQTITITPPDGLLLFTFGRLFTGDVYSATFEGTICLLTEFAVGNQFLNTGAGVASDATVWVNTGGDTMVFAYTGTPYSGTGTVAPEWTRIHVVTRSSETPDAQVVTDAAETQRPAGFEIVLHTATEGP